MMSSDEAIIESAILHFISQHRRTYDEEWIKLGNLCDIAFQTIQERLKASAKIEECQGRNSVGKLRMEEHHSIIPLADGTVAVQVGESNQGAKSYPVEAEVAEKLYLTDKESLLDTLTAGEHVCGEKTVDDNSTSNTSVDYEEKLRKLSDGIQEVYNKAKNVDIVSGQSLRKLIWPSITWSSDDWRHWLKEVKKIPFPPNVKLSSKTLVEYITKNQVECDQLIAKRLGLESQNLWNEYEEQITLQKGQVAKCIKKNILCKHDLMRSEQNYDYVLKFWKTFDLVDFDQRKVVTMRNNINVPADGIIPYPHYVQDSPTDLELALTNRLEKLYAARLAMNISEAALSHSKRKLYYRYDQKNTLLDYHLSIQTKNYMEWSLPFSIQKSEEEEDQLKKNHDGEIFPPIALLEDLERQGADILKEQDLRAHYLFGKKQRILAEEHHRRLRSMTNQLWDEDEDDMQQCCETPMISLRDSIQYWVQMQAMMEKPSPNDQRRWDAYKKYKLQIKFKHQLGKELQKADADLYLFIEEINKQAESANEHSRLSMKGRDKFIDKTSLLKSLTAEHETLVKRGEKKHDLRRLQECYLAAVETCQEYYEKWLRQARARLDDWIAYCRKTDQIALIEDFENLEWRQEEVNDIWLESDGLALKLRHEQRNHRYSAQVAAEFSKHWEVNNRRWATYSNLENARRRCQSAISNSANLGVIEDKAYVEQLLVEKYNSQSELNKIQDEYDRLASLHHFSETNGPKRSEESKSAKLKELEELDRTTLFKWNLTVQKQKRSQDTYKYDEDDEMYLYDKRALHLDRLSQHQLHEVSYETELRSFVDSVVKKWLYGIGEDWQAGVRRCSAELRERALTMAVTDSCDEAEKAWSIIIASSLRALNKDAAARRKTSELKTSIAKQEAVLEMLKNARLLFSKERKRLDRLDSLWSTILQRRTVVKREKYIRAARAYSTDIEVGPKAALFDVSQGQGKAMWEDGLTSEEREEYNDWVKVRNGLYHQHIAEKEAELNDIDELLTKGESKAALFRHYVSYYHVDSLSIAQDLSLRTLGVAREEYLKQKGRLDHRRLCLNISTRSAEDREKLFHERSKDQATRYMQLTRHTLNAQWTKLVNQAEIGEENHTQGVVHNITRLIQGLDYSCDNLDYSSFSLNELTTWKNMADYCNDGIKLLNRDATKFKLREYNHLYSRTFQDLLNSIVLFQCTVFAATLIQPREFTITELEKKQSDLLRAIKIFMEASHYLEVASTILNMITSPKATAKVTSSLIYCLNAAIVRAGAACFLLAGDMDNYSVVRELLGGADEGKSAMVFHYIKCYHNCDLVYNTILCSIRSSHEMCSGQEEFDIKYEVQQFVSDI